MNPNEKTREYYAANCDRINKNARERAANNKDKISDRNRKYYETNHEKEVARRKTYNIENSEKVKAYKSQPYTCDACDKTMCLNSKSKHENSAAHHENLIMSSVMALFI